VLGSRQSATACQTGAHPAESRGWCPTGHQRRRWRPRQGEASGSCRAKCRGGINILRVVLVTPAGSRSLVLALRPHHARRWSVHSARRTGFFLVASPAGDRTFPGRASLKLHFLASWTERSVEGCSPGRGRVQKRVEMY